MKSYAVSVVRDGFVIYLLLVEVSVQFESLSDFIHMNGHGLYVWLSYALGLAIIIGNVLQPLMKRKSLIQRLARRMRRESNS